MYTLPTFNLLCDAGTSLNAGWPAVYEPSNIRLVGSPCALVEDRGQGLTVMVNGAGTTQFPGIILMRLLLPALTDIRGLQSNPSRCDWVICPSGSGRIYTCVWVDDVGKGHANEHRVAYIHAIRGTWPNPYP